MLKRFIGMCVIAAVLAVLVVATAGCNTVHGLGTDIEKGGKAIEKAASPK